MSEPADIAARTQRFQRGRTRIHATVTGASRQADAHGRGIIELRQKGASLRLIRELLATIGVAVGTNTIARFRAEVNGESQSPQTSKRPVRSRRARAKTAMVQPAAVRAGHRRDNASSPSPQSPSSDSAGTADVQESSGRSRARGPRTADPRNL